MRYLADENVPGPVVDRLLTKGLDVAWIRRVAPGSADGQVMERCRAENRVLLTFDNDFGERVFRRDEVVPGVILFRMSSRMSLTQTVAWMGRVISSRPDWTGYFTTVTSGGGVRMRRLKGRA